MSQSGRYEKKKQKGGNGLFICLCIAVAVLLVIAVALFLRLVEQTAPQSPEVQQTTVPPSSIQTEAPTTAPVETETEPVQTEPPDLQPPVIEGVADQTVFVGDTVSYRSGVTVTDDRDPDPVLTVNSDGVDLSTPGEYTVIYVAADAAGNEARAEAKIIVEARPEGYVDPAEIYAEVDEILASIIGEDMTTEEQVRAIYQWIRRKIVYGDHSDREDYVQTAYTTIQRGYGDCFGYFAVGKILMERLDIPNIDVQKVRNYPHDSDHFWSLVSVDGGESYYHFDVTPRINQKRDLCLITDKALDAFSAAHGNSHNRDKALYPATPEE